MDDLEKKIMELKKTIDELEEKEEWFKITVYLAFSFLFIWSIIFISMN